MTEQTSSKVPQIRFSEFSGAWGRKSLGEVCVVGDADHWMPKTTSHGIPYVMTGDFFGINGVDFKNAKLISEADFEKLSRKIKPEHGDILFARYASIGSVRYINTTQKFIASYSCAILKCSKFFDSEYLFFLLQAKRCQDQLKSSTNTGSQGNVGIDSIKQLTAYFPEKNEQEKVAKFLSSINEMLEGLQRKHDKLVTLKKSMLQKMFPQPGSTRPDIRFKGFEEDWVSKSLGDLIDLGSGRDYKHLSPGDIPVYGTGGYMLSVNEALSASANAIGIGRKGTIDKPYILRAPFWTVDTLFFAIPKSENCLDFVYCIFQRIDWKRRDESTGVPSLSKVAINGVNVLSTKPSEQERIGSYFRILDELISQHATQLQKLQQIKSACLERMFV